MLSSNKYDKLRSVCNAASKHKEVCLYNKLPEGLDELDRFIRTVFRFRERANALTADIESMFLHVQVPEHGGSCSRFLWHLRTNEPVQIYEHQRHVFVAKSSPICANYAINRVGLDNEEKYPMAAKATGNNIFMDDFN